MLNKNSKNRRIKMFEWISFPPCNTETEGKKKKKAKKILIKSNEEDILGKYNNNKSKIYNINI